MARPAVDARLQNIEKGILDINKKLAEVDVSAGNCGCEQSSERKDTEKNGESQIDE